MTIGLFAALRVIAVAGRRVAEFKDTTGYREASYFLPSKRVWGYRLALELRADWLVVAFQVTVSVAAFSLLAYAVASQMQTRWVGRTVGVVVLLVGVNSQVAGWDLALLSESLAISMTCAMLAAVLLAQRDPRWWGLFVATFGWWVFLRDGHAYLAVPVVLVAAVAWRYDWRTIALIVLTVWAGFMGMANQDIEVSNAQRNILWHAPSGDLDWFTDRGMPLVAAFDIDNTHTRHDVGKSDEELADWITEEGASVWPRYLVTHPGELADPLDDWSSLEAADRDYTEPRRIADLPMIWPRTAAGVGLLVAFAGLGWLLVVRRGWERRLLLPTLLVGSTVPHHLFAYHASPIEHARHALLLTFVLVLACWWIIAISVDRLVELRQSRAVPGVFEVRDGVGVGGP